LLPDEIGALDRSFPRMPQGKNYDKKNNQLTVVTRQRRRRRRRKKGSFIRTITLWCAFDQLHPR
jgi:hypothetical protein